MNQSESFNGVTATGIAPAPRESSLEKRTREAGREASGTRSNGEENKSPESKYSVVWVTRVHSFIQIFTKHLLSAKYHTRHHGKYGGDADIILALGKDQTDTKKHNIG